MRNPDGSPDMTRKLAGNPQFADFAPSDDMVGLVPSRNLTKLQSWSDEEIKDAFLDGVRPDGKPPILPIMPYATFHNMAESIVAESDEKYHFSPSRTSVGQVPDRIRRRIVLVFVSEDFDAVGEQLHR